ncbi:CDP-alcohol phosphatidyltransferase family protein [Sporolactobacillus shoreicorticis]|uniref:Phosphatidylglycerophosphate synthase n=1 Tax=Sporolactobacillus shoreicorticis TaxID=1923877 RepID=A0ABW5S452_9BACL|nr:CDP-alcohol phosphatidyltransferase family protein [Sporolactobacillus shoreicorticis]MCO7124466.1 CDP-alcohol phosphatidyltransferase family protein [Sporolactobacillus shoreicorticis]
MNYLPNVLSISRIIFVILLLFTYKNSWIFVVLYAAAGLTDLLDGPIARRTNSQSRFGARLDSFADVMMYAVLCILFFYWAGNIVVPFALLIILIVGVRGMSLLIAAYKYHTFVSVHTWGNKLAGLLIFIAPVVYVVFKNAGFLWLTGFVALLSAVEEMLIHLKSKSVNENRRSIFFD